MSRGFLVASASICTLVSAAGLARAHGMIPEDAPIDRLIQNLTARINENPKDAEGYYVLGRCHALVYEYKNTNVKVYEHGEEGPLPATNGWQQRLPRPTGPDTVPTEAELRDHLVAAITNLNTAIALDPSQGRYHLALASVLEAGAELAVKIPAHPLLVTEVVPPEEHVRSMLEHLGTNEPARRAIAQTLRQPNWDGKHPSERDKLVALLWKVAASGDERASPAAKALLIEDWQNQVTDEYFKAMSLALPEDGKITDQPIWGSLEDWVSYEAAKSYIEAVEARGVRDDEKTRLAVAKAALKAFDSLPRPNVVTPVIFSLAASPSLTRMVDSNTRVSFDLDGSGRSLEWSWVLPDTVLLAWDPIYSGRVVSGRQLFGNATWWLLFRNGYEALDALDDNRDGRLTGRELRGIAGWRDSNQNGVSDPGEVMAVTELGVQWLSCRADALDGGCLASSAGVGFHDGRAVLSVDWIATSGPVSVRRSFPVLFSGAAAAASVGFVALAVRRTNRAERRSLRE